MKLSQYARKEGITYRGAWLRWQKGRIPGAYLDDTGHVVVPDPMHERLNDAVVYARVSSAKQKSDLDRQAERMARFANARGLSVVRVVKEVGSGVNDHRVKLTRVGFEWFRVLLARQGKRIVVANEADDDRSDLMANFTSIIYSFAARLYGLRGAKERTKRTVHAFTGENKR